MTIQLFLSLLWRFGLWAIGLASVYKLVNFVVEPFWLAAALVNTLLAAGTICWFQKKNKSFLPLFSLSERKFYFPSLGLVFFVGAAILISRFLVGGAEEQKISSAQIAFIFWIPVVEELTFRVCFGEAFRRLGGVVWGGYFSALFFSFIHSVPTIDRVWELEIGLALGPFLLGIVCEYLYVKTRSVFPIVCFHVCANATVVLFSVGDKRWLGWLSWFYN